MLVSLYPSSLPRASIDQSEIEPSIPMRLVVSILKFEDTTLTTTAALPAISLMPSVLIVMALVASVTP